MSISRKLSVNPPSGGLPELDPTVAFVTNDDRFYSIDISNPSSPTILDTITDGTLLNFSWGVVVDYIERYAYVASVGRFICIDISDTSNMSIVGSLGYDTSTYGNGRNMSIDMLNKVVYYTSNNNDKLISIDVSDPTNPILLDVYTSSTYADGAYDVAVDAYDGYAYLLNYNGRRLTSFDVSNPSNISFVGSNYQSTNLNAAQGMHYDRNTKTVYTTCVADRLTSFDVSNPSNITQLQSLYDATVLNNTMDVDVDSATSVAYVASNNGTRVVSVDVGNPSSMSILSSLVSATFDGPRIVKVDSGASILYVITATKFVVVDISNSSSMSIITSITDAGFTALRGLALG